MNTKSTIAALTLLGFSHEDAWHLLDLAVLKGHKDFDMAGDNIEAKITLTRTDTEGYELKIF